MIGTMPSRAASAAAELRLPATAGALACFRLIFTSTGSPYLIVLEPGTESTPGLLRGIISRARLERQLGELP